MYTDLDSPRAGFESPSKEEVNDLEQMQLEEPGNLGEIVGVVESLDYRNQMLEIKNYDFKEDFATRRTFETGGITYGDGEREVFEEEVNLTRDMQDVRFKGSELKINRQDFTQEQYESNRLTPAMLLAGAAESAEPDKGKRSISWWSFNNILKTISPERIKQGLELFLLSENGFLPSMIIEDGSCKQEASVKDIPSKEEEGKTYQSVWMGLPTGKNSSRKNPYSEWPDAGISPSQGGICKDKEIGNISHKYQYYQDFFCGHNGASYYKLIRDWGKEEIKVNLFPIPKPEYAEDMDKLKDRVILNNEDEERRFLGKTEQDILSIEQLIRRGYDECFEDDIFKEDFEEVLEGVNFEDYVKELSL